MYFFVFIFVEREKEITLQSSEIDNFSEIKLE